MANKKTLIVGMGFGQAVYLPIYTALGFDIVTVDSTKPADFTSVQQALTEHSYFDTVHVCTPNHTHEAVTRAVAAQAGIVFVEKPGFVDHVAWAAVVTDFIDSTRIMMVKNNQHRVEISNFQKLLTQSHSVQLQWKNQHRIPNPGSWFTTKELSFGGVSRDLMPHLLSYFTAMTDYIGANKLYASAEQSVQLTDITHTDYGVINANGVYDVDDLCDFKFLDSNGVKWHITASWQGHDCDDSSITFMIKGGGALRFDLGLCPESAYKNMICTAMQNQNNDAFWKTQYEQDMWIHRQVDVI
jgi:predicted dehydrogenase